MRICMLLILLLYIDIVVAMESVGNKCFRQSNNSGQIITNGYWHNFDWNTSDQETSLVFDYSNNTKNINDLFDLMSQAKGHINKDDIWCSYQENWFVIIFAEKVMRIVARYVEGGEQYAVSGIEIRSQRNSLNTTALLGQFCALRLKLGF